MSLYQKLYETFNGDNDVLLRIAYSVIHKNCKSIPDLKRHYEDMEQSIYECWLLTEVDDNYESAQIVTYAQNKARYVIQKHLMQFYISVNVPKKLTDGMLEFSEFHYSQINFDQETTFTDSEEPVDNWLKSAHYLTIDRKDSWLIFLLSEGFSIAQAGTVMGVKRAAMYTRLNNIKKRHTTA